jgi:hypothetical protein
MQRLEMLAFHCGRTLASALQSAPTVILLSTRWAHPALRVRLALCAAVPFSMGRASVLPGCGRIGNRAAHIVATKIVRLPSLTEMNL